MTQPINQIAGSQTCHSFYRNFLLLIGKNKHGKSNLGALIDGSGTSAFIPIAAISYSSTLALILASFKDTFTNENL